MQKFPHLYSVAATATCQGEVALESERLTSIRSAPPVEFGGPGDLWSPETLFVAAVADCFVLTFRAIAELSRFKWVSLTCDVAGTVDHVEHRTQFTQMEVRARLRVPSGAREDQAIRLLTKAEDGCLVTNSLKFKPTLETVVEVDAESSESSSG